MGTVQVSIAIGDLERENWVELDAAVDTGASITAVPASMLRRLGVEPILEQRFRFAQGEVRPMEVGQAWLRLEGREIITQVLFNEEGTFPLLGALALEGAYLGIDPVSQRLVPVQGLLL